MSAQEYADACADRLEQGERAWAATSLGERRALLAHMIRLTAKHADRWVKVACDIKQIPAGSPLEGEEWLSGPWATLTALQALRDTLDRLAAGHETSHGFAFREAPGNRVAVSVLPATTYDRLLLSGFSAEVWMEPGVTEAEARAGAGLGMRDPSATRGSTLVLGAGNIFSIAPLDTIYQLYAENRVVVLKLNPLTDPLTDVYEAIFEPFIKLGAVEIVSVDLETASALTEHPRITAVHMTGSEATHDAIVWGPDPERAKSKGERRIDKPMTSELGGVSPTIVVPGSWSAADLEFQAQHVATQRLHNSGSNCIASQIVILSADWDQKDDFLRALERAMAAAPDRPSWYPGSGDRVAEARRTHEGRAVQTGGAADRTLLTGLDLGTDDEPAFSAEYFAPVLGVTELPGDGRAFLEAAIEAANTRLRGTLGANLIIHPDDAKKLGDELDTLVAELRYGTVAINAWTGVGYLTPYATWGAFGGHTPEDVQSGIGVVHNALLLDRPERTVVRGPFRPAPRSITHREWALTPKPPWFVNNKTSATTGKRLTYLAAAESPVGLPGVFASALRG